MFINPKHAVEQGWITGLTDPAKQIQPNAIDFTLDKLFFVDDRFDALVGETRKRMRTLTEVDVDGGGSVPSWRLAGQKVYDGTSSVYVSVPEGVAAVVYTRSTLARNGVFLMTGLYDSGYKGQIGFTIYTVGGETYIDVGTRVGQIAFIAAQNAGMYAGGYNHEQGTHYTGEATLPSTLEKTHVIGPDHVGKPAGQQNFL